MRSNETEGQKNVLENLDRDQQAAAAAFLKDFLKNLYSLYTNEYIDANQYATTFLLNGHRQDLIKRVESMMNEKSLSQTDDYKKVARAFFKLAKEAFTPSDPIMTQNTSQGELPRIIRDDYKNYPIDVEKRDQLAKFITSVQDDLAKIKDREFTDPLRAAYHFLGANVSGNKITYGFPQIEERQSSRTFAQDAKQEVGVQSQASVSKAVELEPREKLSQGEIDKLIDLIARIKTSRIFHEKGINYTPTSGDDKKFHDMYRLAKSLDIRECLNFSYQENIDFFKNQLKLISQSSDAYQKTKFSGFFGKESAVAGSARELIKEIDKDYAKFSPDDTQKRP